MANHHHVIPIVLEDPKEWTLPKAGVLFLEDPETGEQLMMNTLSKDCRKRFRNIMLAKKLERDRLFKQAKTRPVVLSTNKPFIPKLAQYFKQEERLLR